jgi:hypothetical protein
VFFDSTIGGGTDPLIDFHNKLNRNLFQKKNMKILKRFYEPEPILTERKAASPDEKKPAIEHETKRDVVDDPFEEFNARSEQKKPKKDFPLNDEKTDYILEQRAIAITTMTTKLNSIATQYPLSKRLVVKPAFKIMWKPTPKGYKVADHHKGLTKRSNPNNHSRTLDNHNTMENLSLTGRLGFHQPQHTFHTTKSTLQINQSRKEKTGTSNLAVS